MSNYLRPRGGAPVVLPAPAQTAPTMEDPAVEEARRRAEEAELRARGRRATILTGGEGATDLAPTRRKRLLGE